MTPGQIFLLILTLNPTRAQNILDSPDCKFTEDIYQSTSLGKKWSYQDFSSWDYGCRNGQLQSPIDLPRANVVGKEMGNLTFQYYASSPLLQRIVNTGHSIMMDSCDIGDRQPKISGSGLNGTYVFHQMHFHWADINRYIAFIKKSAIYIFFQITVKDPNTASLKLIFLWNFNYFITKKSLAVMSGPRTSRKAWPLWPYFFN